MQTRNSWIGRRLIIRALQVLLIVLAASPAAADLHWEFLNPYPVAGNIVAMSWTSEGVGFLITDAGIIVRSTDNGRIATRLALPEGCEGFLDVVFFDSECGWALGSQDVDEPWRQYLYWTADGGRAWRAVSLGSEQQPAGYVSLFFLNPALGWVCGSVTAAGSLQPAVARLDNYAVSFETALPQGRNLRLNDVFFQNSSLGIAVGQHGYIGYTETGGQQWTAAARVTDLELLSVCCVDFNACAVGGDFDTGLILNSLDGGVNWAVLENHPADSRLVKAVVSNDGSCLALASGWGQVPGRVLSTAYPVGYAWESIYDLPARQVLRTLEKASNCVYISGDNGFLVELTLNHGVSARQISRNLITGSVQSAYLLNDRVGWFAGENGCLLSTSNGGSTLNVLETGIQNTIYNAYFLDQSTGFLTCEFSAEYYTANGGRTWQPLNIADDNVNLITFSGQRGYATHGTAVSVSNDAGRSWTAQEVIQGARVPAIALSSPVDDIAYVASTGDSLRRTSDGGRSWQAVNAPFSNCYGVCFISQETGWALAPAVQGGIRLYSTINAGETWQAGTRFDFIPNGVHFFDIGHGWIWANPGRVVATEDSSKHWNDMNIGVERILRRIHVDRPNRLWIVGDGGLIARWGENWLSAPPEESPPWTGFRLLQAYPNPTNGCLNLNVSISMPGSYHLTLLDMTGRRVLSRDEFLGAQTAALLTLDLNALPSGCYQVLLQGTREVSSTRFILLR